jgi:metal transporter CNNM
MLTNSSYRLVVWLMYILSPLGYPIALLLDQMLGTYHDRTFSREGLKTLIMLHEVPPSPFLLENRERLHPTEVFTACKLLSLSSTPIIEAMTPLKNVLTLMSDTLLDDMTRDSILRSGHGRIPVFGKEKGDFIVGVLNVRSLIGLDFQGQTILVGDLELEALRTVKPSVNLAEVINIFRDPQTEMVVVTERGSIEDRALGIVTFRDVMGGVVGKQMC